MTVIARDAVASDHLVYAWPFPIGPECEVTCADDEQVVMCPAWLVGDRLGPGHHRWRTPDPTRPVAAFFVLLAPVEVSFDMTTMFIIPATGQPIRLRAVGALQVRCGDPGLLVAQFVGLPFDRVNDGILRSVSRSVERMLARLLTRRVVMAATPAAVTDGSMLAGIMEELVAYNPTAGAVFGIDLIRVGHLAIAADDGSTPYIGLPNEADWSNGRHYENGDARGDARQIAQQIAQRVGEVSLVDTARGRPGPTGAPVRTHLQSSPEISLPGSQAPVSGEIRPRASSPTDDITQPGVQTPVPGAMRIGHLRVDGTAPPFGSADGRGRAPAVDATPTDDPHRGAIMGVGMTPIGQSFVSGEIAPKVPPGARVLVPGPNGLMQSATVRQLLQGYYELEVGSSGETIWVPIGGVVPER